MAAEGFLVCTHPVQRGSGHVPMDFISNLLVGATVNCQNLAFELRHIDRPEPGQMYLLYHDLQTMPTLPSDGLRYGAPPPHGESSQRILMPLAPNHPLFNSIGSQLELEITTLNRGFLPPESIDAKGQPVNPSGDTHLCRFRKRYRLVRTPFPQICLIHWGIETNLSTCPPLPGGWDREPVRSYPLPVIPKRQPVYPFRSIGPRDVPPPTPVAQQPPQAYKPIARQNPKPTVAPARTTSTPVQPQPLQQQPSRPGAMAVQQQQMYQQHQAAAAQMAAHHHAAQQQQQQQQQMQHAQAQAQAQARQAQAAAAAAAASNQPRPPDAVPEEFETLADALDQSQHRTLAIMRFRSQHAALGPVFDAWSVGELLEAYADPMAGDSKKSNKRGFSMDAAPGGEVREEEKKVKRSTEEEKEYLRTMLKGLKADVEQAQGARAERRVKLASLKV